MEYGFLWIALIIALPGTLTYIGFSLPRAYNKEVKQAFQAHPLPENPGVLTEEDLAPLPLPVQKYLRYVGVVGREKVYGFRFAGDGDFKTGKDKDWVKAAVRQTSFVANPLRLYYMKLQMGCVPVLGLHVYKAGKATMRIKLAGLLTVGNAAGDIMDRAETVTVFNDMCLMAPATLIDSRIQWQELDSLTVEAAFTNGALRISARLYFNETGELVNFISNDRYMTSSGTAYVNAPWSTPVRDYRSINGFMLASNGEAHWALEDGNFCYGKIHIKEIEYNPKR